MGVIHDAASGNILELLQKCLDNGVSIEARDGEHGRTPLHFAAERGHVAMAKFLLARGAKPDSVDFYGLTPAEIAEENGHTEILNLFRGPGPVPALAAGPHPDAIYPFTCQECGKVLRVPGRFVGTAGRCSRCGAHMKVVLPPPFDEKFTKSLDAALTIVFDEALPTLPFQTERAIREDYERLAKAWRSQELVEASEKGLRGILEKNLRILEWRSDFQGFQIVADLESTAAIQIIANCDEANRPIAIRIWRGSEHYYLCGGLDFIPHP